MNGAELGRLEHLSSAVYHKLYSEVFAAVFPRRVKGRTNKQWRAEKSSILKLHPLERLTKGVVHLEVCMSNELTPVHVQRKSDCCTCPDNFSYISSHCLRSATLSDIVTLWVGNDPRGCPVPVFAGRIIQTTLRSTPWLQLTFLWSSEPPPGKSGE